jgi:hypothetical protein
MNDTKTDSETTATETTATEMSATEVCVLCAREMLESQLPKIKDKGYDFAPQFRQMTIQLYLVGVMWRQGESLGVSANARDHAFMALESMLISDGMKKKEAQKRIAFLNQMSRVEGGDDALAVSMGYQARPNDESIVAVFDEYRNETRVSGSLWRLYERGKKIMVIGGAVAAFLTVWFVTIFLPKTEGIDVLAAGLIAAALVVLPTFLVGLLIYRMKIRKAESPRARQS